MSSELDTIKAPENKVQTRNSDSPASKQGAAVRRPLYDVSENEDAFNVRVSLPGVSRDGVDISLEDDTLTVVGTRTNAVPESWRPLRRELETSDYRLSLRLNVPVNEAKIKARVADGVLDLTLPKADEVKPRKIKIS